MPKNDSGNNRGEAPVGMIARYDFAAPTNWLSCDGATKSATTYPALFAVIGYEYGGSGDDYTLPTVTNGIIRYI
jgi:microcystin-dependent protein